MPKIRLVHASGLPIQWISDNLVALALLMAYLLTVAAPRSRPRLDSLAVSHDGHCFEAASSTSVLASTPILRFFWLSSPSIIAYSLLRLGNGSIVSIFDLTTPNCAEF